MGSNHKSQGDQNDEIVVFSIINPSVCSECGAELVKAEIVNVVVASTVKSHSGLYS